MTATTVNAASADAVLEQEIDALEAVLTALGAEHNALETRNAEALTAASAHKLQCIETARQIGAERSALLPDGVSSTADPQLLERWDHLVALARTCKEKNERNGMLISWQRRYIEQTLAVLRNDGCEAALYGPDGASKRRRTNGGSLGSA